MPETDAFAGIKLSGHSDAPGVEQRLFSTGHAASGPEQSKPETQQAGKPGSEKGRNEGSQEARKETSRRFDLAEVPTRKGSFVYTTSELEALEDLKLEFRRQRGVKVTMNDLARCAIHLLVEDYRAHQERSFLGRRFPVTTQSASAGEIGAT